jgi:hypothetical protein
MLRQVLCAKLPFFSSLAFQSLPGRPMIQAAVGVVEKVDNEAKVVSGDTVTPAITGTPVHLKDELPTGPDGRIKDLRPHQGAETK